MLQALIFNLETERRLRAHKTAKSQQSSFMDHAFCVFTMHAMKREINDPDYSGGGQKWSELSYCIRNLIEIFNQLPIEARPTLWEGVCELGGLDHVTAWQFVNQLDPSQD